MINIQTIQHVGDCVPLYLPHSLYLKPLAKINISVALPTNKTGKSISNLDIMDKLSAALKPDKFHVIKVSKSTVEFIRFEAELDERTHLRNVIARIDGISLKISGFHESFRVRASEPKEEFPTRYDWDSFFRDASNMDEMKAGERPDTIHITHLPIRWFCPRHTEHEDNVKPSESIFRRIFEKFGTVRCVDIPICDPYRSKMNSDINGMKTFSFEQDVLFEAYVQFDEYVGFVRAMDEFRGMKLVRKFVDKTQAINISVNFDKTKHLSEAQIQRRERVRKRVISKAKLEEEDREKQKKLEKEKLECERKKEEQLKLEELEKQREREERRKEKHLKKIQERGQVEISQKIRIEERKLMIAQRKLESIRILEQLFNRIKLKRQSRKGQRETEKTSNDLRNRLVEKYKTATELLLNEQKKKVDDIKSKTPLLGLLNSKKLFGSAAADSSDEEEEATKRKGNKEETNSAGKPVTAGNVPVVDDMPINPFRAVATLANAGNAAAAATPAGYPTEAASEWMKSLSMFPYVPSVFPGMSALYRPPSFGVSMNYRGFAPRIRIRGRGRGRGRGGNYDSQSSSYYNNYKHYNYDEGKYDDESGTGTHYRKSNYESRSRNRSYSRSSRSRSRSHTRGRRSHSRSRRSRTRHYSKRSKSRSRSRRSRTHSRSYTRSRSKSKTRRSASGARDNTSKLKKSRSSSRSKTSLRINKKLVSTRRSRSSSDGSRSKSRSRSRSHSRSYTRSKRSWSRRGGERSSRRSSSAADNRRIRLETDKLVRSAEEIKRTIEKDMKDRMREEEREIKENFRHCKYSAHKVEHADALRTPTNNTDATGDEQSANNDPKEKSRLNDEGSPAAEKTVVREDAESNKSENAPSRRRHSLEREADIF